MPEELLGIVSYTNKVRMLRLCGSRCRGDDLERFAWFARVEGCVLDGAGFGARHGLALRRWSLAGDQRGGRGGGFVARGQVDVGGAEGGRRGVDDLLDGGDIFAAAEALLHGQLGLDELDELVEFGVLEEGK